jgi:hypothetical protein
MCPIPFDTTLPRQATAAQDWVRLLLMVHRQLQCPDSLMRHSMVLDPLVDSLIHGLLLVADHPYRQALAAPAKPGRPAAVRDAMDMIEAGPHLPLTTSTLAKQCHVGVRTLQEGPTALEHVTAGIRPRGPIAPRPSGSAVRGSLPQQRRLHRAPLGVHPPRTVRRRPQNDVRPSTAPSPARCTLNSQTRNGCVADLCHKVATTSAERESLAK